MATSQKQIDSTTQKFLDIYDITNNLVILKDGTTSLVLTVDAMNFGLLAEEEQDSIMYAYAGLLNSLNYPIQILIKSQTKDVTSYLNLLKEQENKAINNTQRQRIMKYREFVSNLIRERNVLDKKFYVTIPAKPLELGLVPVSSVIPGKGQIDISTIDKSMIIEKAKSILEPKRDHLISQFARIGLYSRQLETQEIIQMFYQSYNPEAFEGQHMDNSNSYTAPLVSASIEGNNMDNQNNPNPAVTPATPTQSTPEPAPVAPVTPIIPTPTSDIASTPEITPNTTHNIPVAAPTPEVAGTPVITTPATNKMATPNQEPTMQPTIPITPSPESTNIEATTVKSPGYSPTKMDNNLSTPNTPEPATNPNVTANEPTPVTPAQTPTPPTPELPITEPGKVDTNVPQEVEIKIEHPSEKGAVLPNQEVTNNTGLDSTVPTPVSAPTSDVANTPITPPSSPDGNTDSTEENKQNNESNGTPMPPLPEIK